MIGGSAAPGHGAAEIAAIEGAPGRPWLLVRSIGADPSRPRDPSRTLVELPGEPPTPARLDVTGLPAGVRLVSRRSWPPDGTPADPRTLYLAWIPVTGVVDPTPAAIAAH